MWFTNNIFISHISTFNVPQYFLTQISDVDEADNAVFRIEEDDEIIDVDI